VNGEGTVRLEEDMPVLNGEVLEELSGLQTRLRKPKLMANALHRFRATAPGLIARMRAGLEARDAKAIGAAGHALGSSSGSLGAMRVREVCKRLDLLREHESLDGVPDLLAQLEAEYAAAVEALDHFIRQHPS
jgi:HPt (histidine-containing phosphotransfer) domain-containing protein